VTGFLPTVTGGLREGDLEAVRELAAAETSGAAVLGLHFEGPFVALAGAIPPGATGSADPALAVRLLEAAAPLQGVVTLSPEIGGAEEVARLVTQRGGRAFISHTAASAEETRAVIEAGARHATHFYNVFPCPPETEPGVRPSGAVEAVLADRRATVDFILDGEHVDPVAVGAALACKGVEGVALITDANVGAGLPGGRYRFAGQEIVISRRGAAARLGEGTHHPGALAGSGLTMDRAVRNAVAMLGLELHEAVGMASASPAAVLGLAGEKGRIEEGRDADLVLLDDDLAVAATWVGGRQCYSREEGE
jgi:N-acetylglucosamine-6-phosphate deacetylase